jgi:hypothetical protein
MRVLDNARFIVGLFRMPSLRRRYLWGGFIIWVGLRLAAVLDAQLDLSVNQEVLLVVICVVAVQLDSLRRREYVLLGNLGIPWWGPSFIAMLPPTAMELFVP